MSEPYEPRDDRGRRNLEQAHAAQARKQARADARAETASREPWYRRDGWILAMAGLRTAHSSLVLIAWIVLAVLVVIFVAVVPGMVRSASRSCRSSWRSLSSFRRRFERRGMPLQPRDDGCAVIGRAVGGQWGDLCDQPATRRAVWRFDTPGPRRILLCDQHAAELTGHERLTIEYR